MKVYKYYTMSDFSKRIFTDQEIYFSQFSRLNDPFEIAVNYTFDCDEQKKIDYFLKVVPTFSQYTEEGKRRYIKTFEDSYSRNNGNLVFMLRDSFKNAGVFCVSEDPYEVLMWSHYTGKHRGFCVEFDTDKDPIFSDLIKVQYSAGMQNVLYYDGLTIGDAVGKKFDRWSYEKEWRAVKPKFGSYKINPQAMTAVYLGALNRFMPVTYKENGEVDNPDVYGDASSYFEVINTANQHLPHLKFFRLKMHPREYKVEKF